MDRLRAAPALLGLVVSFATACTAFSGEDTESTEGALAVAGRWQLPTAVAEAGAKVRLKYDGAPNWSSRSCSGRLTAGARRLGEYLQVHFPGISSVGGYACRRNTAQRTKMSVHGTGRALDIFIPTTRGDADNGKGDAIANWLVLNSERVGVQLVIWDRTQWQANGRNDRSYRGPSAHIDHLHVELTVPASTMGTAFFLGGDAGPIDVDEADADVPEEMEEDAGTPSADAGSETPDAAADADPDPDPDPYPDAEPPPDPTGWSADAGSPNDVSPPTPTSSPEDEDDTSTMSTEPIPDDEPEEYESEGLPPRPRTASSEGGCSAAPSRSGKSAFAAPLALVVAASLLRRRRRR